MTCPEVDELYLLLDGELTENRAAGVRAHVDACAGCQEELRGAKQLLSDLSAEPVDASAHVDALMQKLEEAAPRQQRRVRAGLAVAALAAALLLFVATREEGTFRARGAAQNHSIARDVGVSLYHEGVRLTANAAVRAETAYVASYRNLGEEVFLMVFAVDAKGDVHWLYPGYTNPDEDPVSVPLSHSEKDVLMNETVVLETPAPGTLRMITVVSPAALRVSQVESQEERSLASFQRQWPSAQIGELAVEVRP